MIDGRDIDEINDNKVMKDRWEWEKTILEMRARIPHRQGTQETLKKNSNGRCEI